MGDRKIEAASVKRRRITAEVSSFYAVIASGYISHQSTL